MNEIDAVITNLDIQIESLYVSYGHFVSLRFIDIKPSFPKVKKTIQEIKKNDDLLIKMASVVQRALNSKAADSDELLSDADKEMLFQSLQEMNKSTEEDTIKLEKITNE